MKKKFIVMFAIAFAIGSYECNGQIVSISPFDATSEDSVEIIYDVSLSATGINTLGITDTSVYMHSGVVITPNGTDWTRTRGNWGANDGVGKMKKIAGTSKWSIKIVPRSYYSVHNDTPIYRLAMVFRNVDGTKQGKGNPGVFLGGEVVNGDIYVNFPAQSQIVTLNPKNASPEDSIEIIYNTALNTTNNIILASKTALNSTDTAVYMHSGIVINPNGTGWARTRGNWGANDGVGKMKKIARTTKWRIKILPRNYYNVSSDTPIYRLAMVFRNADGTSVGKGNPGVFLGGEVVNGDIYVNFPSQSQIVTLNPVNANPEDSVEIIYDVALNTNNTTILGGSTALNATTTSVYMHSAVITTRNGITWERTIGNWGMDDGVGKMKKIAGTTKWTIKILPRNYYNVNSDTPIYKLVMVFRNADGTSVGKGNPGVFVGGGVNTNGDISVNLSASRVAQSITFGALTDRTYGYTPFVLQASSSSSLPIVYSASNTIIEINSNTVTINRAGTVRITAYQSGNKNYLTADSVVQILTIHKAYQSVSFEALDSTFGQAPFVLQAISSSSLPIVYSASNTIIEINSNTVTINRVGTVRIIAYQSGNENYLTADSVVQILTIHPIMYKDIDKDGLIEVSFIEQLDFIRYNLTGTCSVGICNGYELTRNLDFRDSTSYRNYRSYISRTNDSSFYAMNRGWNPINGFAGTFHGNDSTISHLFINRPNADNIGFFGKMSTNKTSVIKNLGLLNVNIKGYNNIGSLVGINIGRIERCYTTGTVTGLLIRTPAGSNTGSHNVGGLVGSNGTIYPYLDIGYITQSYTTVSVIGYEYVGGFVGWNSEKSSITQRCYATGTVQGDSFVGGFFGLNNSGYINECYAIGSVTGYNSTGEFGGSISYSSSTTNIFWNSDNSVNGRVPIGSNYNNASFMGQGLPANSFPSSGFGNFPQVITFTLSPSIKTYGDAVFTLTAKVSSLLQVSYSSGNTSVASINGSSVTINGVGTVSITAIQSGNADYSSAIQIPSVIQILTVNKAKQSISFRTLPLKTYGDKTFKLSASVGASLSITFSSFDSSVATVITGDSLKINKAGTVQIIALHTGNSNYLKDSVVQILTIHKIYQSVSFEALASKTFGDVPFVLSASSSSRLPVIFSASNTLINIDNNTVTIRGAGTVGIAAYSGNDTLFGFATQILTIHKIYQSISFEALASKTFGDVPFVLSASSSSRLPVIFSASNTLISIDNNTVTIRGAGTVGITAYSGNDTLFGFATQLFTIHKAYQSISFETLTDKTFGQAPFVLQATSSGSLPVVYSASNTIIGINNNIFRINKVGTVRITAYQTGNENYLTADSVVQTLTIHKAYQSIFFEALASKTYGDAPFVLSATSSAHLPVLFSTSNTLVRILNNVVIINGGGTVSITAYSLETDTIGFTSATQILTIHKIYQSVSFEALASKTFGDAPFVLSATSSAHLPVFFSASNTLINIDNNTVTIRGAGTVGIAAYSGNDTLFGFATQILTIHKIYQSVSFEALASKTFGDVPFVLQATSSGGLPIVFSASSNLVSIHNNTLSINGAGTVSIIAYNTENENYLTAYPVVQILTIHKAYQSVSFEALASKTFGDVPFVLQATSSGGLPIVFSASSNLVSIHNNTLSINGAGTVSIIAYNTENENYLTAYPVVQILTIHKAYQSVSFEALADRTFGQAPFVLQATSSGGLPIVFSASSTLVSINNDTMSINGAGTVSIIAYNTENENYLTAYPVVQILTIHKAIQDIEFEVLSKKTFGDTPFVLSATSSGGLPIIFSASSTLVSIHNNTVSINGVGIVSIIAHNTGNENYLEASAIQVLTIIKPLDCCLPTKRSATITFAAIPNLTVGQKYILMATSNSSAAISFTSSDVRIATVLGNTLTAVSTGTTVITASQVENAQFTATTTTQFVKVVNISITLTPIETKNSAIRIFPNPTKDYITIQTNEKISSVKVYDMVGKNYELGIQNYELGIQNYELGIKNYELGSRVDIKILPKGEYILVFYGENGEVLKAEKVMKY